MFAAFCRKTVSDNFPSYLFKAHPPGSMGCGCWVSHERQLSVVFVLFGAFLMIWLRVKLTEMQSKKLHSVWASALWCEPSHPIMVISDPVTNPGGSENAGLWHHSGCMYLSFIGYVYRYSSLCPFRSRKPLSFFTGFCKLPWFLSFLWEKHVMEICGLINACSSASTQCWMAHAHE